MTRKATVKGKDEIGEFLIISVDDCSSCRGSHTDMRARMLPTPKYLTPDPEIPGAEFDYAFTCPNPPYREVYVREVPTRPLGDLFTRDSHGG